MNRLISVLLFILALCVPNLLLAELPVTTNASFCTFNSSYFTLNCVGLYLDGARYGRWWTNKIHCYEDNRSGGSTQEANENRLERLGLAQWANGSQYWGIIWADSNGGYDTNSQASNALNTFTAPGLFYNGHTYTNEGGWAAAHAGQIHWIGGGSIPYAGHNVNGSSEEQINNAMTNAATQFGYIGFDIFHKLNTSFGWTNDIVSGANLRQQTINTPPGADGEHPGASGALAMAIIEAQMEMDTNVNTSIIDLANAVVVSTNHCVITDLSYSNERATFTKLDDSISMPFDSADGTITNDASNGFVLQPALSNAFYEVLKFTNVTLEGNWVLNEDGSNILTVTSADLRGGINLFAVTKGALWAQRKELLGRIRDKMYCDRVTLVNGSAGDSQGQVSYDSFAQSFWDSGFRGDALTNQLTARIANLNAKDALIWSASIPTNHVFTLTFQHPIVFPFLR